MRLTTVNDGFAGRPIDAEKGRREFAVSDLLVVDDRRRVAKVGRQSKERNNGAPVGHGRLARKEKRPKPTSRQRDRLQRHPVQHSEPRNRTLEARGGVGGLRRQYRECVE